MDNTPYIQEGTRVFCSYVGHIGKVKGITLVRPDEYAPFDYDYLVGFRGDQNAIWVPGYYVFRITKLHELLYG